MDDLVSRFSRLSLRNLPELPGEIVRMIYRRVIILQMRARAAAAASRIQAFARAMRPRLLWRANVFQRIRTGNPLFTDIPFFMRDEQSVRYARRRMGLARDLIRRNDITPTLFSEYEYNFVTGRSIGDWPGREPGFR